jgi:hypothetical protein
MKNIFRKIISLFSILLLTAQLSVAHTATPDFIDLMRQGGKIYVVYLLLGVILIGVLIYLVVLERRLKRLEEKALQKKFFQDRQFASGG